MDLQHMAEMQHFVDHLEQHCQEEFTWLYMNPQGTSISKAMCCNLKDDF